jgi:Flp pilus assembly protein TadD
MRAWRFFLLLVLSGCGHVTSVSKQPGIDVAQAALRGGSPETALKISTEVLSHDPGDELALLVKGDALTELGQTNEARLSYSAALSRNPDSVRAEIGLGRLLLGTDPAAAEVLFLKALHTDPRSTIALNDLGVARDLLGNHAGAQEAYRRALGLDPQDTAARINLALSMGMGGDTDQAVRILRSLAQEPNASAKIRHDLAAVLAMSGNQKEASEILSTDLSPDQVNQALEAFRNGPSGTYRPSSSPLSGSPVLTPALLDVPPGPQVQFAAAASQDAAQAEWQRLKERIPELLEGKSPTVQKVESQGHWIWRLRTSGFKDSKQASSFCEKVHAAGEACIVAAF